jgi:hypothetical protein
VRRVFEIFVEIGSGIETGAACGPRGTSARPGRPLDKGDVYKLLNNRTYIGEAVHKGQVYPGEHAGDRAAGAVGPGACRSCRSARGSRAQQSPAQHAGAAEGADLRAGRAGDVADHTRKGGRLYRYYVASAC